MAGPALTGWSFVFVWAGLRAIGGVIGGIIGASLVAALTSKGVLVGTKR